jgi:hypothetical protein
VQQILRHRGLLVSWGRAARGPSADERSRSALLDIEHSFGSQIVA